MPENKEIVLKIADTVDGVEIGLGVEGASSASPEEILSFFAYLYGFDFKKVIIDLAVRTCAETGREVTREKIVGAFEKVNMVGILEDIIKEANNAE